MDVSTVEKVLIASNIKYEITRRGVDVFFGLGLGSFSIIYDRKNDALVFGSSLRWFFYLFTSVWWVWMIVSVFDNGSMMEYMIFVFCVGMHYTIIVVRELKLLKLKKAVEKQGITAL